jgi:hypothetical protein
MGSRYRGECLKRDGYLCRNCGVTATHAHHIVPVAAGGFDVLSNLAALCDECHGLVHGGNFTNLSALTKAGLQKAKERGVRLGGTGGSSNSLAAMSRARTQKAENHARAVGSLVKSLRSQGNTLREIATVLNDSGYRTAQGFEWKATQVQRVLRRLIS